MAKSIPNAVMMAVTGDTQDEDSQIIEQTMYERMRCALDLPTSSSPAPGANAQKDGFSQELEKPLGFPLDNNESQALETPLIRGTEEQTYINNYPNDQKIILPPPPKPQQLISEKQKGCPPGWTCRRDSYGNLRQYDRNGGLVHGHPEKMAHSSSDSTTQELDPSVHEAELLRLQSYRLAAKEPTSEASLQFEAEPSTFPSTSAHSLGENDTGHIDLVGNFTQREDIKDFSQDQSYAAEVDEEEAETQIASFPETPVTASNPFEKSFRRDTLDPSQLFTATQVSPNLQIPTSAASERPSPDIYSADHIASPQKKAPNSSPSTRGSFNSRTALSRRRESRNYVSRKNEKERRNYYANASQSSDGFEDESQELHRLAEEKRRAGLEICALVSVPVKPKYGARLSSNKVVPAKKPVLKEQLVAYDEETEDEDLPAPSSSVATAKKAVLTKPLVSYDDETEDEKDAPANPRNAFKCESNSVILEQKSTPKELVLADEDTEDEDAPSPSADVAVPGSTEVPNTAAAGRRRSDAEEYLAQTNGTDARDTQQDDMVIDSQAFSSHHHSSSAFPDELPELDNGSDTEDSPTQHSVLPEPAALAHDTDPLCETSANAPKNPKSLKSSSLPQQNDIVPETSPYPLRRMEEIDEDSSPVDDDQSHLTGIGFTQDDEWRQIMSQSSLPPPRSQRTPTALISKSRVDMNVLEVGKERLAPEALPSSSFRRLAGSAPPVLEVDATPKISALVDAPVVSTGPTVLETPQASSQRQEKAVNELNITAAEQYTTVELGSKLESHNEKPSRITKKRKPNGPGASPSKRLKISENMISEQSDASSQPSFVESGLRVALATEENSNLHSGHTTTDTGLKYSTAPEAHSSSTVNSSSVQSSSLSELSGSASPATPEAFKGIVQDPNIASERTSAEISTEYPAESIAEISVLDPRGPMDSLRPVDPKGTIESLKRKRATDTPPSSLTPTAVKSRISAKPTRSVGRPKKVSQGAAKAPPKATPKSIPRATPKVVQALRGQPPSTGTRSSIRQAATELSSIKTPNKDLRGSASTSRSTSHLSIAPSLANSNAVLLSTPVKAGVSTKKSGKGIAGHGLFHNMAFAVSYVAYPKQKEDVLAKIYEENGLILEYGFDELFTVDDLPITPTRSTRRAAQSDVSGSKDLENIKPNDGAREITFACVIADNHSRKSKYMQALSLDLPCLHGNWILKCVVEQRIVDWVPYLLCAGQPDLLGGAHRSRALVPYSALSANFSSHFESNERPKLLRGKSVLVVVGTTKAAVDKRKAYVFVIHALGAEKVGTVPTAAAARVVLETDAGKEKWDWLYVDRNEELGIRALEGPRRKKQKPTKKRVNDTADNEGDDEDVDAGLDGLAVKVVGDHYIVQSLILGKLLDEGCAHAYNDPVPPGEEGEDESDDESETEAGEAEEEANGTSEDDEDELS